MTNHSNSSPIIAPYGTWSSPLSAGDLAQAQTRLGWPEVCNNYYFYLASIPGQPQEIWMSHANELPQLLSLSKPTGVINIDSKVHEYGGKSWTVLWTDEAHAKCLFPDDNIRKAIYDGSGPAVVVSDKDTQQLWIGGRDKPLRPLTAADNNLRFACPILDSRRHRIIAVCEDHNGQAVTNYLVSISLLAELAQPEILVQGSDFYDAPTLSPNGEFIAWIEWDLGEMPWTHTRLQLGELSDKALLRQTCIADKGASLQPIWMPGNNNHLVYANDISGFSNLYIIQDINKENFTVLHAKAIYAIEHDFTGPAWQVGIRDYCALSACELVVNVCSQGIWRLARITFDKNIEKVEITYFDTDWEVGIGSLVGEKGQFMAIATTSTRLESVIGWETETGFKELFSNEIPIDRTYLATGIPITWPTTNNEESHGFYYPPTNPLYRSEPGEQPPLIMMVHGGPTAQATRGLSLAIQFWTTRGFAVLQVNHRGSTGYGRAYQDSINGAWGCKDVADCETAIGYLAQKALIDPQKVAIRGGSAGGFTTLACITFSNAFSAGCSRYGIGDLEILASDTHKFESRYMDIIVGQYPAQKEKYQARSPIHHVAQIAAPMIILQGEEDKVVPPNQAYAMANAVRDKGLPVALVIFAGEGHGFRNPDTIVAAQNAELSFYCQVWDIIPADKIPALHIENLG